MTKHVCDDGYDVTQLKYPKNRARAWWFCKCKLWCERTTVSRRRYH